MSMNSAFRHFPEEMACVGRMIIAFGELEFMYCRLAGFAMKNWEVVLKSLYRLRISSNRIDAAEELMRQEMRKLQLYAEFTETTKAVRFCSGLRNQYAHCHWGDDFTAGIFFASLENSARRANSFAYDWRHVDIALLKEQEAYFDCAGGWLHYLQDEIIVRQAGQRDLASPKPQALQQPILHNPRPEHVPPWLSKENRALQATRSREDETRGRSPQGKLEIPKRERRRRRRAKERQKPT